VLAGGVRDLGTLSKHPSMADRYFVELPISGERATLVAAEAHHLAHVMRAKPGTLVTLFDGGGCEFAARVERVGRSEIELSVLDRKKVDRELAVELTLAAALPKGDRQRWLIEKAVELGVTRFVPLGTERGVAQPSGGALERLRRAVIEASKQCGRNRLMEIADAMPLCDLLADGATAEHRKTVRWVAHPGGIPLAEASGAHAGQQLDGVLIAVGPEGGLTVGETSLATDRGWQIVGLGARILRVETASLMLAAVAAMFCDKAGPTV
jgi:16S rRNA (uracil1498-N3)-methyltransferase